MNYLPIYPQFVSLATKVLLRLKPGERFCIEQNCIDQTALDHVLSGKVGSAYEHGYTLPRPDFPYWEIFRLKTSLENDPLNRRTYVDPDRRWLYSYDNSTGIYTPMKPLITPRPITWDKTKTLIPCQCPHCQTSPTPNYILHDTSTTSSTTPSTPSRQTLGLV